MSSNTWTICVAAEAEEKVVRWIADEDISIYRVHQEDNTVQVGFDSIDDAFRFRMQFDEDLVS